MTVSPLEQFPMTVACIQEYEAYVEAALFSMGGEMAATMLPDSLARIVDQGIDGGHAEKEALLGAIFLSLAKGGAAIAGEEIDITPDGLRAVLGDRVADVYAAIQSAAETDTPNVDAARFTVVTTLATIDMYSTLAASRAFDDDQLRGVAEGILGDDATASVSYFTTLSGQPKLAALYDSAIDTFTAALGKGYPELFGGADNASAQQPKAPTPPGL